MGDAVFGLTILFIVAIGLTLVLFICHKFDLFTFIIAWIYSSREEKVSLTRLKGHFNANGYLVHSDSDFQLGTSGSFKRFDSIDKDIKVATTSFIVDWNGEIDESIPPQPLRPAPVPIPSHTQPSAIKENVETVLPLPFLPPAPPSLGRECTETSIKPLPRPVSSINMTTLQHSNADFITPPPSQSTVQTPIKSNSLVAQQVETSRYQDEVDLISAALKRALSCDSVCSDTSVALGDLETSNITGYLCIALEYDSENAEMIANILEAKDLRMPTTMPTSSYLETMDSYVKISLLPDKNVSVQTRIYKSSNSPSYQERVIFSLHPQDQMTTALLFHVYATNVHSHTLIGEGELKLADISLRQPVTTWVTLTDTGQRGTEFGELMFSLSYLPTAERLTVVVVKGRNLKFQNEKESSDSFVKVYLLQNGKKVHKKKTSIKKSERSPIFNESMMFSVPVHTLQTIQLRLTVSEPINAENARTYSIGHVIVGDQASGRSRNHWNQMLTALRRPVAMWHPLRK